MNKWWCMAGVVVALILTGLAGCHSGQAEVLLSTRLSSDFESAPLGSWKEGSEHPPWRVVFDSHGQVAVVMAESHVLQLRPEAIGSGKGTRSALVVSTDQFADIDYRLRMRTVEQLRTPQPNDWETAWAVWGYSSNARFYYFTLKTNGWELGKRDPAYPGGQRYLQTGTLPAIDPLAWQQLRIQQQGRVLTVWVGDTRLTQFRDEERPYLSGAVGLYGEDAVVQFDDISVEPPAPLAP